MLTTWLPNVYLLALTGMSVYGFLGLVTLYFFIKHHHERFPTPLCSPDQLPRVTIQLPIYNEKLVVCRLIDAAASLTYPLHLLQIQVIDDSTDETSEFAIERVAYYRRNGLDIQHLRRSHRTGFKGGALQEALASTRGEMVAIFDADFIPPPDFLQRTIPHFVDNPALGVLQTRWGHLNPENSALTAAQAIALDKHFSIDQKVRFQANLFPKFNGTAGIWRRRTMEDAGGWEHDTVTEDLDLSTRAVLKGWSFRFLDDVVTAAELPVTMAAFKNQQARWAKGSTQCLLKYGRAILSDRKQTWIARLYALLTMSAYCAQLLLILLLLLALPLVYFDIRLSPLLLLFVIAGIGQPLLFTISQKVLYDNWQSKLRHLPTLLLVAVGLAPSISRAIIQAIFTSRNNFVRTPKGLALAERSGYQLPFDWIILCELALSIYALAGVFLALQRGNIGPLFFLLTCTGGMGYVAVSSLLELWRPFHRARSTRSSKQPA